MYGNVCMVMYCWMDGWMYGCTYGWVYGCMDVCMYVGMVWQCGMVWYGMYECMNA